MVCVIVSVFSLVVQMLRKERSSSSDAERHRRVSSIWRLFSYSRVSEGGTGFTILIVFLVDFGEAFLVSLVIGSKVGNWIGSGLVVLGKASLKGTGVFLTFSFCQLLLC